MALTINRVKTAMVHKRAGFLSKIKEQLLTYSKVKRALLLIILLILPLGLLWVFLIIKADEKNI